MCVPIALQQIASVAFLFWRAMHLYTPKTISAYIHLSIYKNSVSVYTHTLWRAINSKWPIALRRHNKKQQQQKKNKQSFGTRTVRRTYDL